MKYRVHFEWPCGTEDFFTVEGDDIEEVRGQVANFFESRGLSSDSAWSEEL